MEVRGAPRARAAPSRTPTGTSLLGLVKHCAFIEAGYFGECLGREHGLASPALDGDDPNADLYATAEESAEGLLAPYRQVGDYVDATLAELPADTPAHVPWWGERADTTLGALAIHVLYDVSRHAGHADIIREAIDGAVGLAEGNSNLAAPDGGWPAHVERLRAIAEAF